MEKKYIIFTENIHGNLSETIKGLNREEKWSDLWYIFKPEHFEKTLAQMDEIERKERRKIDGSVEALKVFAEWYENNANANII